MIKLLIFSALLSMAASQQLLSLSSFQGGNYINNFNNDAPYGIFVSAHSDSQYALNNIFVVLKNGTQMSLSAIRKISQASGPLVPYVVTDSAYLTTSLTTNQLASLNGVIYLSTTAQLNKNFNVYDIASATNFDLRTAMEDTTSLFLNTHMGTNPYRSTVISGWKQDGSTSSYLYTGVPLDSVEPKYHQIFSNPMHTSSDYSQTVFFSNVEKFSLATTVAFYLKTFNGGPSFRIEPSYFNIDASTTTSTTTTGFFMKPKDGVETSTTVHIRRDTKYSGTSGASTLGSLERGGMVSVSVNDGSYHHDENGVLNDFGSPWSIPYIGENIKISSTNAKSGVYYVQYFVQQGPLKSATTAKPPIPVPTVPGTANPPIPVPTIPGRTETTTKSSVTRQLFVVLASVVSFLVLCK